VSVEFFPTYIYGKQTGPTSPELSGGLDDFLPTKFANFVGKNLEADGNGASKLGGIMQHSTADQLIRRSPSSVVGLTISAGGGGRLLHFYDALPALSDPKLRRCPTFAGGRKWEHFPNLHCPRRHENDLKDWLRRRSAGLDHRTCHGKSGAPRHRSVGTAPGTCHAGLCGYRARSALRSVAWTSISSVLARRGKLSGSSSSCW